MVVIEPLLPCLPDPGFGIVTLARIQDVENTENLHAKASIRGVSPSSVMSLMASNMFKSKMIEKSS